MIKSMNFNFVQAAANMFSYFKTKVQLHLEVEYQTNIRYTFVSLLVIPVKVLSRANLANKILFSL